MMYNNGQEPVIHRKNRLWNGVFLTLEGIDGCGKTTQMDKVLRWIQQSGQEVLALREPGGTAIGESIRQILLDRVNTAMTTEAELLLFAAARAQLVGEVIRPALEKGTWVVCDRFMDSTVAYQGYGRELNLETIRALQEIAVGECRPDLTLLLDVPVEEAVNRLSVRKGKVDRLDLASRSFMERTRQGYLKLAAAEPERFRLIDSSGPEKKTENQIQIVLREDIGL